MAQLVLSILAALGIAAAIGLPLRLVFLRRAIVVWPRLGLLPRWASLFGLVLLLPASIFWFASVYAAYRAFFDPGVPRVWGISELGLALTFLGIVYLAAELLALPLTLAMRKAITDQSEENL